MDFKVIFNYRGLVFILHHLKSDKKVCFGGSYRPKNKDPSMRDFNTSMMATIEDIKSSEVQDSRMLTNHSASHDHDLMERHAITKDLQQNISRITGDSNGKGKSNITSFITGNTRLRQCLEEPPRTPSMWLERDYKTRLTVNFGDMQPTLMARPPFSHNKKTHEELIGRTERPREETSPLPLTNLNHIQEPHKEGKGGIKRERKTKLRTGERTTMT